MKITPGVWRILLLVTLLIGAVIAIYVIEQEHKTEIPQTVQASNSLISTNLSGNTFSDGLENPTNVRNFQPDDAGMGITEIAEYIYDINQDGRPDRISRARRENGTAHLQYIYKIELNDNETYIDITPRDFVTIEGADCALQKLQFSFKPDFSVTKISRPMGDDWNTPTQSTKTIFSLWGQQMHIVSSIEYKTVCDVAELY